MVLGDIQLSPLTFAPHGWHRCDGTLLSISDNVALFSLLSNRFGGDGQSISLYRVSKDRAASCTTSSPWTAPTRAARERRPRPSRRQRAK